MAHSAGMAVRPHSSIGPDYPHDAQDFRQCVQLVHSDPRGHEQIRELARTSLQWRAILNNWDTLEQVTHVPGWNASSLVRGAINNEIRAEMQKSPTFPKVDALADAIIAGDQNVVQVSYQLNAQDTLMLANILADKLHRKGYDDYHIAVSEPLTGPQHTLVVAARPFGRDRKDYLLLHTLDEFPLQGRDGIDIMMAGPGKDRNKVDPEGPDELSKDTMAIRFAPAAETRSPELNAA